jgi:hypothetical protein
MKQLCCGVLCSFADEREYARGPSRPSASGAPAGASRSASIVSGAAGASDSRATGSCRAYQEPMHGRTGDRDLMKAFEVGGDPTGSEVILLP